MGEVVQMPPYEPWREVGYLPELHQKWREEKLRARAAGEAWAQLKPPLHFPMPVDQLKLPFETLVWELPAGAGNDARRRDG